MTTKVQIDQLWKQFREAINKAYDHADFLTKHGNSDDDRLSLRDYVENMSWSDSLNALLKSESANEKQHRNGRPSIPGFSVDTAAKLILLNNVVDGSQLSDMPKATGFLVYRKTAAEARVIGFLARSFLPAGFIATVESLDYAKLNARRKVAMIETTVNIPFKLKLETDSNLFGYVDHDLLHTQTYAKAAKAKDYFRKHITEEIEEGLRTANNSRARAIGCANGTVFIVRYSLGSWYYAICGPDRTHGGACLIGANTFDSTYDAAKRHAEQNGGIVWENSL